jgi:hypothetical protein
MTFTRIGGISCTPTDKTQLTVAIVDLQEQTDQPLRQRSMKADVSPSFDAENLLL